MERTQTAAHREPWNEAKIVGQKAPLRLKDIWALRVRLKMASRVRELALFNRNQSDMLAAKQHLERWRLVKHGDDLVELGSEAGLVVDAAVCRRVAAWGYTGVYAAGGSAWWR